MKRYVCVILVLALLVVGGACAAGKDRPYSETSVAIEIARQFQASFDDVTSFDAESWYDNNLDAIILKLTTINQDHSFYEAKRADNDIASFYAILSGLNVYSITVQNLKDYNINEMDVYVLSYSSDGVLEYLEVNGNDLTEFMFP